VDTSVPPLSETVRVGNMIERIDNPFRITKSNDLSDEQIDQLWVTGGEEDGVTGLARPSSPMAMFILGGKGSGKSHLMRYYSFPVQLIRYRRSHQKPISGIANDGYLGIYSRCGGLDSHRFSGKGQSDDAWNSLFAYYFELWVADKTFGALEELRRSGDIELAADTNIAHAIADLFDRPVRQFESVSEIRLYAASIRRQLDYSVNNAALTNRLEAEVLISRGRLFFGIPNAVCSLVPKLQRIVFVYLLDEFENFTISQQTYINTLIREREGATSFKVGARLYGIRTKSTLSGGERNLQGSEYEELRLDERFRNNRKGYETFALRLIARRLGAAFGPDTIEPDPATISKYLDEPDLSWNSPWLAELLGFSSDTPRPHIANFQRKLFRGIRDELVNGVRTESEGQTVVEAITFPEYPLIEKLCILYLYQQWFRAANLYDAARHVKERAVAYIEGVRNSKFDEFVSKHKGDMIAQLLRENGQKQIYAGLHNFVRMSEGLPRTLITILKHIYDWSIYTQERPFRGGKISIRAQQRGITEAAEWFLDQMLEEGEEGVRVRASLERLSQLFRTNRFADKPIETSLIAFSVDEVQLHESARRVLSLAQNTSLVINVARGQRERNSEQVTSKLELNVMLAPRWDLPIARRGVVSFAPEEANAIFVFERQSEFEVLLRSWEAKMTAPSFGRGGQSPNGRPPQADLFE